ncbi:hypothetical protein [Microcella flavibacter]|uniref:hypothetical protein n=1 Tax=Microcella flavibacter TaxID=1804990 RepID=UPI0014570D4A|nr:hypothetical protein [Microcella flavibacter]
MTEHSSTSDSPDGSSAPRDPAGLVAGSAAGTLSLALAGAAAVIALVTQFLLVVLPFSWGGGSRFSFAFVQIMQLGGSLLQVVLGVAAIVVGVIALRSGTGAGRRAAAGIGAGAMLTVLVVGGVVTSAVSSAAVSLTGF